MIVGIRNLPDACSYATWRQRVVTAASITAPVNLTTVTLSSLTAAAALATATFGAAHGLVAGDRVIITGATPAAFNGAFDVYDAPSSTTVRFQCSETLTGAATGTITAKAQLPYRVARFIGNKAARTANTGTVYLGLDSTNDAQPLAITTGATVVLEAATGCKLDLSDLWLDVATAADGVLILWH